MMTAITKTSCMYKPGMVILSQSWQILMAGLFSLKKCIELKFRELWCTILSPASLAIYVFVLEFLHKEAYVDAYLLHNGHNHIFQ